MPLLIFNNKCIGEATVKNEELQILTRDLVEVEDYYLTQNGRILGELSNISDAPIHIVARLRGGKGGFGSMLRAIGAQIEKTTNREACRDLSGRRLRDINEEKRLKTWLADKEKREKEAEEKKKKKLERLAQEPKHEFTDKEYDKERSEMVEKVHSAVEEGLKAATATAAGPSTSQGVKRKDPPAKKGLLWIDAEELGSDDTDSDDDDDGPEIDQKKAKVAA